MKPPDIIEGAEATQPEKLSALLDRTRSAIQRITSGLGAMCIPADPADPYLVLGDWLTAGPFLASELAEARKRLASSVDARNLLLEVIESVAKTLGLDGEAICEDPSVVIVERDRLRTLLRQAFDFHFKVECVGGDSTPGAGDGDGCACAAFAEIREALR